MIASSLRHQGFRIIGSRLEPPSVLDKEMLRELHREAVQHRLSRSKKGLFRRETQLLNRMASGTEVDPEQIAPKLIEVRPGSEDELLFRYATLHWSIPVSSGYGRRLRFLVVDQQNGKLIGLFGLGDPIFSLAARDNWVGWTKLVRARSLRHVMDAYVLGAVPPYSHLLCGKLVAMLVTSNEVTTAFRRKYSEHRSVIARVYPDPRLALVTTTSALGRSSLYNRVRYEGRLLFQAVGFTQGSGEFHFSNGLYATISKYALKFCQPTAKQTRWGHGFRNRREVIKKCLAKIGLPTEWLYHGIRREVYVIPLASNCQQFLRGEDPRLVCFDQPASELFAYFRKRWLMPRCERDQRYRLWRPSEWQLWTS